MSEIRGSQSSFEHVRPGSPPPLRHGVLTWCDVLCVKSRLAGRYLPPTHRSLKGEESSDSLAVSSEAAN